MKISHEVPICMLEDSRDFNDYCYALVHLFETHPDYLNFYKESVKIGREVILDNSLYELGKSFDGGIYNKWINELKPTYYIIPDTFSDSKQTIKQARNWFKSYNPETKSIGVVHGKTINDIIECYREFESLGVDKIAFNFADEVYKKYTRLTLIEYLLNNNIIDVNKKHHLLGCEFMSEFSSYTYMNHKFIDSIDTSNPIMYGYEVGKYFQGGSILTKPVTKVIDILEFNLPNYILENIKYNIKIFREVCNG